METTVDHPRSISPEEFTALDALERVRLVDEVYGDKALLLASMQETSGVIMHLIHRVRAKTFILFVDTQFHFKETLETRDKFIEKYGLNIETVYPELTPEEQERRHGCKLYNFIDGQPECCRMRKEEPFLHIARQRGIEASMAGLMREEGGARGNVAPIAADKRLGVPVYHPIFDWTYEMIGEYTREHDVPVHPLYAKNYMSIGCEPCTTPVLPGEDRRAGRWRHLQRPDGSKPQYCNINFTDMGAGI